MGNEIMGRQEMQKERIEKKERKKQEKMQANLMVQYVRELEKPEYDVLTKEEEVALMKRYREKGDTAARQELIKHNLRLIPFIVNRYNVYTSDVMDLIQVGNLGLLEAVENFDPTKDVRFASYAVFIVKKHIFGTISSDMNKVYIPFGMTNSINQYRRLLEEADKKEIELTDEQIMERLNIKPETLKTLKKAYAIEYISMEMPICHKSGKDQEQVYIADIISDDRIGDPAAGVIAENNFKIMLEALEILTPREYDIVTHVYGLGCEKESSRTLSERYGISMERVCQIRKHACGKMKKYFNSQGVYSFEV